MVSEYAKKKLEGMVGGTLSAIVGCVLVVIGVVGAVSAITEVQKTETSLASSIVTALMVFALPGVIFLYRWRKMSKAKKRYKTYVYAIDQDEYSLIDLMALSGYSYDEVERDLRELIGRGWYPGAHIDRSRGMFVRSLEAEALMLGASGAPIPTYVSVQKMPPTRASFPPVDPDVADLVVRCPVCGELNYRTPELAACEFCGTDLRALVAALGQGC